MKPLLKGGVLALAALVLSYGGWQWFMASRVAEVKQTIAYHNQRLKAVNPTMVLKAEEVRAAGFPLHWRVEVSRLTLSMIEADETFLVAIGPVGVTKSRQGAALQLPDSFEALYAKNGAAPEQYRAVLSAQPELVLTRDAPAQQQPAPFTHVRMALPRTLTLKMTLDQKTREARFDMPPSSLMTLHIIPDNVARELWLLVSVMREALVYDAPGTPESGR